MSKSDVLDLLGVCCLALFAFAVWPPACLAVMGLCALLMSRQIVRGEA